MSSRKTLPIVQDPFYVKADCCTMCGLPEDTAPDLFGRDDEDGCIVKKQPHEDHEVDRMLQTMLSAEFGCIRYAGTNRDIRRRLAEQGEASLCDHPYEQPVARLRFDHAGVHGAFRTYSLNALVKDFTSFLSKHRAGYRVRVVSQTSEQCDLGISWYEDVFHSVLIRPSNAPEFDWLVVGLPFVVNDWLRARSKRLIYGFYTADDWNGPRTDRRRVPW